MPVKLTAVILLAIGIVCSPVAALGGQFAKAGAVAPDFKVKDLSGKEFKSSQLRGSVVVLDLWATWCEPCIADIPMFNRLYGKYAARNVKVVGIAVQSGLASDIKQHVAKLGIHYQVLAGDDKVMERYVNVGFPTRYLISQDGTIVKKYLGAFPEGQTGLEMDLERELEKLLQVR